MASAAIATKLLTETETAELLGIKRQTLSVWRCLRRHTDLRYLRIGRAIRYRAEDVEKFLQSKMAV